MSSRAERVRVQHAQRDFNRMEEERSLFGADFVVEHPQPQLLTPLSPSLPTSMPPVAEAIPALPVTPPSSESDADDDAALATAVRVLSTEATALACMSRLYQTDPTARRGFVGAVDQIAQTVAGGGKLVICGVGKSGKIGHKLVATMNSLGVLSVFLHPTEALHGDLGVVRMVDTILLITFSGQTAELRALMPHLPRSLPLVMMSSHQSPQVSPLTHDRPDTILLPTPVHESEEDSFGLSAPTTSTTVALALGDALAMAVARRIHVGEGRGPREVFKAYHPGGAIGMRGDAP
ncbi:MAG: hypothetical protein M1832_005621 [Thelocarpon impressellum]|nr:MAG: hypothetical protein M1832_005621 [Thelocarpon impressellum]